MRDNIAIQMKSRTKQGSHQTFTTYDDDDSNANGYLWLACTHLREGTSGGDI